LTIDLFKSSIFMVINLRKNTSVLCVLASGILWGFMGYFRRSIGALGVSGSGVVLVRCLIAAILCALTILIKDKSLFKIKIKDLWCFLGTGLVSFLFFTVCYFTAMTMMSLSTAAILLYTAPCFVVLMSAVIFKEKLTGRKIFAVILAFAGCCFVCGIGNSESALTLTGILFGLGSGIGYALYSIFGKLASERGYNSITINFYTMLIASIGALVIWGPENTFVVMFSSGSNLILCLAAGLFSCYLPYMLYTYGLSNMEPGSASVIASIEPVVATFVGLILFDEKIGLLNLFGVVLVLTAVVLVNLKSKKNI